MKAGSKIETGHKKEKEKRRTEEQFLLVHAVNNPPCHRTAEHRADLEAGHGHPCLPLPLP